MSTHTQTPSGAVAPTLRKIDLVLLALDLTSCTRCIGTLANMEKAIEILQQVLQVTGFDVRVQKMLIASEAQARQQHGRRANAQQPAQRVDWIRNVLNGSG